MTTSVFDNPEKWMANVRLELQSRRVNETFDAARRIQRTKFSQAYRWLTSLDPKNVKARKTVQRIFNSDNPGAALMAWYEVKCEMLRVRKGLRRRT